jgi:hypothetical protein
LIAAVDGGVDSVTLWQFNPRILSIGVSVGLRTVLDAGLEKYVLSQTQPFRL